MKRDISQLGRGPFDLLVIGGGVVGAWTAYDAALRGLSVALIDKGDWGSGTSQASSKLIHGGLRYLERFEFTLVRKSLAERRLLARLGPHRVRPLRFVIPVYRQSRVGPLRFRLGLLLYDSLAGRRQPVARHQKLSRHEAHRRYQFLNDENLRCAFTFGDCQTDDARFTLELVGGATDAGAVAVNYAEATELIVECGEVAGARVSDLTNGRTATVSARVTVNATGVWSRFLKGFAPGPQARYRMTKGVHLILPALPTDEALLLTAQSDGRVFFVIPWYGRTLLGTTDTDYTGNPDQVAVEPEDAAYLLAEANRALSGIQWTEADVLGSFCGLRMLRDKPDAMPSAVSRDWWLYKQGSSLLASIGGKFTTARQDAAEIVDAVCQRLGRTRLKCQTADRIFPWAPAEDFKVWRKQKIDEAMSLGIDRQTAAICALRYGVKIDLLLDEVRKHPNRGLRVANDLPFCWAEVYHASEHEMALYPQDVLRRRVPVSILTRMPESLVDSVAAIQRDNLSL